MISYKEERNLLHLIVLPESNINLSHRPVIPSPTWQRPLSVAQMFTRLGHGSWCTALPFEFCFCFCAECTNHVVGCNAMTSDITDVTGHHVTYVTSDVLVGRVHSASHMKHLPWSLEVGYAVSRFSALFSVYFSF